MTASERVVVYGALVALVLNALGDMGTQSRVKLLEAQIQSLQVERISERVTR
jgi:hypothetical protein